MVWHALHDQTIWVAILWIRNRPQVVKGGIDMHVKINIRCFQYWLIWKFQTFIKCDNVCLGCKLQHVIFVTEATPNIA